MLALAILLTQLQALPPQLVALDSDEGQRYLLESTARRSYFALAGTFLTQKTQSFCGVTSSVMVLNAMPVQAPIAAGHAPFRAFTEDNVFDATGPALTAAFVNGGGLTLEQLQLLLASNHVQAEAVAADASSEADFRARASRALSEPNHQVLVDFLRTGLGQDFGAHWSPLAAYHSQSDRFLVLDVARFRYPPYWARAADLWKAMDTRDLDSGKRRGYVVVSPLAGAPGRMPVPLVKHRLIKLVAGAAFLLFAVGAVLGALLGRRYWRRAGG